jgi:hypothetical protein
MDKERFEIQSYVSQRDDYYCVVDNQTGKPIPGLSGAQFKRDYEPVVALLNELHNQAQNK